MNNLMAPLDLVAGFDVSSQTAAIEELILKNVDVVEVLRLLCLQSLIGGNLKSKDIETLRRQFLQVFHLRNSINMVELRL
jgi:vacuolar protein sorting-associated protein 33A